MLKFRPAAIALNLTPFERLVQRDEVLTGLVGHDERFVESHAGALAPAFLRVPRARVVDQDATHHTSGHREEMRSVPCHATAFPSTRRT